MRKPRISRTRVALAVIFVTALATRAAYLDSNPRPLFGLWVWGAMAHNIVDDGHWFEVNGNAPYFGFNSPAPNYRLVEPADVDLSSSDAHPHWVPVVAEPVGEAVLLAGLWKLTGSERFLPDAILRIVLDAFAALLVYRIAMRLLERRRAALIAAAAYALYPPLAWVVSNPNLDFWGVDFTIAIVALYLEALNSPRQWRWLIACGVLTGLGSYFRPGVLVLPAALALATILLTNWRDAVRRGLFVTAVAAVLLIPWAIRNYEDFHAFIPTRTGTGETLWIGLGEIPNDYGPVLSDYAAYHLLHRLRPDVRYLSPEFDALLKHRAIRVIEQHPLFYAKTVARRLVRMTVWSFDPEWMRRGTTTPLVYGGGPLAYIVQRPLDLLQVLLQPLVFLFAMLGLAFTWARHKRSHLLLIAVAVSVMAPYAALHLEYRYLLPAAFIYLIWIGLGADLLLERLGSTQSWAGSAFQRSSRLSPARHQR